MAGKIRSNIFKLTTALTLGVLTTITVAWGCTLWSPAATSDWNNNNLLDYITDTNELDLSRACSSGWRPKQLSEDEQEYYSTTVWNSFGLQNYSIHQNISQIPRFKGGSGTIYLWNVIDETSAGWPLLALWGERIATGKPDRGWATPSTWNYMGALPIPTNQNMFQFLPYKLIWPGFLINTLIYFTIWFALLFGLSTTRHIIRKRKGNCINCGYILHHNYNTGCPECGWNRAETDKCGVVK